VSNACSNPDNMNWIPAEVYIMLWWWCQPEVERNVSSIQISSICLL